MISRVTILALAIACSFQFSTAEEKSDPKDVTEEDFYVHYDAYHSLQSDVDRLMFDLRNHRRSLVLSLGNSSVEERQAALKSHYESFENEYAQLELLLSKRAHHRRQAKEELRSYNAIGSDLKSGNEQHYLPSDLIESGGSPEEIKSLILAERLSARVEAEISDLVDMAEAKGE